MGRMIRQVSIKRRQRSSRPLKTQARGEILRLDGGWKTEVIHRSHTIPKTQERRRRLVFMMIAFR
jgi:hypothetical protein